MAGEIEGAFIPKKTIHLRILVDSVKTVLLVNLLSGSQWN